MKKMETAPWARACFRSQGIGVYYQDLVYFALAAWDKLGLSLNDVKAMPLAEYIALAPLLQEIVEEEQRQMKQAEAGHGSGSPYN